MTCLKHLHRLLLVFGGFVLILQGCSEMPVDDGHGGDASSQHTRLLPGTAFEVSALEAEELAAVDLGAIRRAADLGPAAEAVDRRAAGLSQPAGKASFAGARIVQPGESIQEAVSEAAPGATIFLSPGTYRESITIDTPRLKLVGLRGRHGRVPVVGNPGSEVSGITIVADGVALVGIDVHGFEENGVLLLGVDGFVLLAVNATDNGRYGIATTSSANGLISHCSASGSADAGLFIFESRNTLLHRSTARENVLGIEVENSSNVLVLKNRSVNNVTGLLAVLVPGFDVETSENLVVRGNEIRGNNLENFADSGTVAGAIPSGLGLVVVATDRTRVIGNQVNDNDFEGIVVISTLTLVELGILPPVEMDVDPDPDDVVVARNTARGNGSNPPPPRPGNTAIPGADLFWDGSGSPCWASNHFDTSIPDPLPSCGISARPAL